MADATVEMTDIKNVPQGLRIRMWFFKKVPSDILIGNQKSMRRKVRHNYDTIFNFVMVV